MAKTLLWVFGGIFVLVGLMGWVSNPIVGPDALFVTDHMHDFVHLLIGLVLLGVAFFAPMHASLTLKVVGGVYLLVALLGFVLVPSGGSLLGLIETNMADHLLHVVLGVVILGAGFMYGNKSSAPMGQPEMM